MTTLIDTNVIVRFLTGDKNPKYKNIYHFFRSLEQGEIQVDLKHIVLFQTIFVLKSYYKIPQELVAARLLDILDFKGLKVREKKVVRRMLTIFRDSKLEPVDCYLAACLEGDRRNILYSYDRHFDSFAIDRREP